MPRSQLVYREIAPEGRPPVGTIVVLHGAEATLEQLVPLARTVAPEFRAVAPQAAKGVYLGPELVSYSWYLPTGTPLPELASFGDALYQLEQFVYDVVDRDEGRRPVLLGYDQGAVMALTAIGVVPDFLAGVAAIAGYVPELRDWTPPIDDAGGLPVILVTDPTDESITAPLVTSSVERLEALRASVRLEEVPGSRAQPDVATDVVRRWLEATVLAVR